MKIKKDYKIHTLNTLSYNPYAMSSKGDSSTYNIKGSNNAYEPYVTRASRNYGISKGHLNILPIKAKDSAYQFEATPEVPI